VIVFLNGRFVLEPEAVVSVFDRGFLYGDGLFETVRVHLGRPFRWPQHVERLQRGAEFLGIQLPGSPAELGRGAAGLIARNRMPEALLRVQLSRGVGPRGYSPRGADAPTLVMTLHPAPADSAAGLPRWTLSTASLRLPVGDALAMHKTCSKLPQILARAEADARGADEALLLNAAGELAEAAGSNLFWISAGRICTPPLSAGILPGITRAVVLELCTGFRWPVLEVIAGPGALRQAEAVFLTLSSWGIVEAVSLDGQPLRTSPQVARLRDAYQALMERECAGAS
jgi:aminodeoxychorismate lyase